MHYLDIEAEEAEIDRYFKRLKKCEKWLAKFHPEAFSKYLEEGYENMSDSDEPPNLGPVPVTSSVQLSSSVQSTENTNNNSEEGDNLSTDSEATTSESDASSSESDEPTSSSEPTQSGSTTSNDPSTTANSNEETVSAENNNSNETNNNGTQNVESNSTGTEPNNNEEVTRPQLTPEQRQQGEQEVAKIDEEIMKLMMMKCSLMMNKPRAPVTT